MTRYLHYILLASLIILPLQSQGAQRFGEKLCKNPDFTCKIVKNDTWESLFPNPEERDIVKRVNRMNIRLRSGMQIAIPKNLERITIYDVSPFQRYIEPKGEKTIYVNQKELAWAAYDEDGELVWWGPISSGINTCRGALGTCETPSGSFRIVRKQGEECISTAFPRRIDGNHGGAVMPYCMHFYRGYALHGSPEVPGYKASHGCVRMFTEDARWLNENFISTAEETGKGTRVVLTTSE